MPAGRETKLTPELQKKICEYIAAGNYACVACQAVGVSDTAFYNWQQRGENDKEQGKNTMHVEFLGAIKKAEAEAEARNVLVIQKATKNTWQAAAWYLERKHAKRWALSKEVPDMNLEAVKSLKDMFSILEQKREPTECQPEANTNGS